MKTLFTNAARRRGVLYATAGVAALAFASPVLAQDSNEGEEEFPTTPIPDTTAPATGDVITVTGSRIRRPEIVGTEPTTSISDDYYEDRNITSTADAINELPQFRGSVSPRGDQASFGAGVNFVNTFGLGSNRTLSLVNGRRVVSSNLPSLFSAGGPGVQVDLNIIPTILIERIDNVFVGGAPVYGSDAIAGTVNIILKDQYEGLDLSATSGISERGDAFTYNVSGVFGQNFADDRGNVTLALSYDDQDGVRGSERQHVRDNVSSLDNNCAPGTNQPANDGRVNPNIGCNTGPNDGVPARVLFPNVKSPYLSTGGVITDVGFGLAFNPDGTLRDNIFPGTNLTGFFGTGLSDGAYDTADQTNLTATLERFTANLFLSYEITPGVEAYGEGLYYKSTSIEEGNNPSFNTFVFDPGVSGGITYDIATNPFLTDQARATLTGLGLTTFNVSRSNEDLFDNGTITESELKRGVLGIRGDFGGLFGNRWNYDVSVNYGENEIENFGTEINQQRFINAVNYTTDGSGNAVCTTTPPAGNATVVGTPIADANCVPLNLLGVGVASQAALDYISEDVREVAKVSQVVVGANFGGDLFDTWAGPVGFNVGAEYREETASFTPSAFTINGEGRGAAVAAISGSYDVKEVFGEVLVPLASPSMDLPFLYSAEVFGRVRYVDNSVNGGFTAYAVGGTIAPIQDITFRGNFTRSFRAPAITELFLPQSPTFERPPDLCTAQARNAGPVPATRSANCNAFLAATGNNPATYTLLAAQASVAGLSGGNPNLQNEKADSFTFGVIVRPRFLPGLTVTADYIDIEIDGPIAQLDASDLASGCFDNPNFNTADPINGNAFCSALGFGPNGQIPNDPSNPAVVSGFVNGQSELFEGITGALDYGTSLGGVGVPGALRIGGDLLYVQRRIVDITGVAPQRSDGIRGDPQFSGQARLIYSLDNFGFGIYANYIGEQLYSRFDRGPSPNDTREIDELDDYVTVNLNTFFETDDGFRFNFGVTNLFDRIGQEYFGYIIPGSENDDIGRRYTVSVSKSF
ncbi:MAG: TonB-dependent receptor [Alteriqipengyuania sp.]|uniref:TonB-dependent receptor domain-containing protein n=2 Tax=Alteriqipengyuania sp. TaxID=2800692 RepID=UPI00321A7D7B